MKKIKESGKLVVGTEAQYAPYEFKDLDANFAGCDMWLAQQIADALGVELEVVDMSFDGIIPAVQSSQVDIGIAAFTVTEERARGHRLLRRCTTRKSPQAVIVEEGQRSHLLHQGELRRPEGRCAEGDRAVPAHQERADRQRAV